MAKRAFFEIFQKSQKLMPCEVFDEEPKTGLEFENSQQQHKCWRKSNMYSLTIQDMYSCLSI